MCSACSARRYHTRRKKKTTRARISLSSRWREKKATKMPFISKIQRQSDYRRFSSNHPIVIDNGGSYFRIGYPNKTLFLLICRKKKHLCLYMRNFRTNNCGSSCRWAGESDPRVIFRNIIQRPRHKITGKVTLVDSFCFVAFPPFFFHPHDIHERVIVDCFELC